MTIKQNILGWSEPLYIGDRRSFRDLLKSGGRFKPVKIKRGMRAVLVVVVCHIDAPYCREKKRIRKLNGCQLSKKCSRRRPSL